MTRSEIEKNFPSFSTKRSLFYDLYHTEKSIFRTLFLTLDFRVRRYFTGNMLLFCFVVGTDLGSAFKVDGQIKMTIAELKDVIYEKNKNDFENKKFDANKLNLWLVDIPYDPENVKLRTLQSRSHDMEEENIIIRELGGKKLSPFDDIGDIFKNDSKNIKNIRIIVQPPATIGKCLHLSNKK